MIFPHKSILNLPFFVGSNFAHINDNLNSLCFVNTKKYKISKNSAGTP